MEVPADPGSAGRRGAGVGRLLYAGTAAESAGTRDGDGIGSRFARGHGHGQPARGSDGDPARIGSQGGFSGFATGFNGRIYMVALYRRSLTPQEIHLRARDPYLVIRRPLATARVAKGPAPPPAGDSGKGSIVIAIAC